MLHQNRKLIDDLVMNAEFYSSDTICVIEMNATKLGVTEMNATKFE